MLPQTRHRDLLAGSFWARKRHHRFSRTMRCSAAAGRTRAEEAREQLDQASIGTGNRYGIRSEQLQARGGSASRRSGCIFPAVPSRPCGERRLRRDDQILGSPPHPAATRIDTPINALLAVSFTVTTRHRQCLRPRRVDSACIDSTLLFSSAYFIGRKSGIGHPFRIIIVIRRIVGASSARPPGPGGLILSGARTTRNFSTWIFASTACQRI